MKQIPIINDPAYDPTDNEADLYAVFPEEE